MSVLSLTDAKLHLNITVTTHDAELQEVIDAAEAVIAKKCGPLSSVAVTEQVSGGGTGLVLKQTPVVSLTSVTPVGGTAYTVGDFTTDLSAGVVEWTRPARFAAGRYDVVYQAGRSSVPDDLLWAIKELVRSMWKTQRGSSRRPGSPDSESAANTLIGAAQSLVFEVERYLAPHVQVGN